MTPAPLKNSFRSHARPPSGEARAVLDFIRSLRNAAASPNVEPHFYSPVDLSQMEGAYSQLETAVYLFLLGAPPAAVHTLAGAAQEVLRGLVKNSTMRGQPAPPSALEAHRACISRVNLNEVRTFLKHDVRGKSAVERTVTIDANENMLWIWDCLESWKQLGNSGSEVARLFLGWLLTGHSQGIVSGDLPEDLKAEIMEELGLEYPVPRVLHFGPWLIDYLSKNPETKVPAWVLAAGTVTSGSNPVSRVAET